MPAPNNYGLQTKVLCSQTTPSRQTTTCIAQQMCSNAKGCSRQSPTVPERSPSERLHVHWNKQLLPRTRIDLFKTILFFSGSLAWNSLSHHLRYPRELKNIQKESISGTH